MKKIISILLVVTIFIFGNCIVQASEDEQYNPVDLVMGDVNGDGEVNVADCLNFRETMVNKKNAYILCEYADLNGDFVCNVADLLILRKQLCGFDVQFADYSFGEFVGDVTNELQDLGKNNFDTANTDWDDSNVEKIDARNPNDMIAYKSKVYVTGGNYDTNQGPVRVTYYSREYNEGKNAGTIDTEQINRFYKFDDVVFTTSIDERTWGSGSVSFLKDYRLFFQTNAGVLQKNIHCYDMSKFGGTYFFAGSAVDYNDKYLGYSGSKLELSKGIIYMFKGSDITKCTANDFVDVPIINKNGVTIKFDTDVMQATLNGGSYYYDGHGVPRVYDLFEWRGDLYALYYDQYMYNSYYDQSRNYNGLYKYDAQKQAFVFEPDLKIDIFRDKFVESQDKNKILHDFEWGDRYYFVTDVGLLSTNDFKNYQEEYIDMLKDGADILYMHSVGLQ